ncbi:MAG: hypothetical protein COX81_00210 [Candidatus Magasanikbacteria bacterium CG_4_10_14_0_2_um_filter_37_12]|uniref:Putative manganese efflux pump MntP n=1 Tax=Candidatus Magasanikbacteria bacterium CG_4_10_14_0_2_um_filter_37_12 TaxID=1974637 RepID=A0A2M7VA96_9BACT|nr:MAG: hypothetical protein COX81_00210 [Candidatus Magasanikbacteria bacterium CG_4_10_14_0_2_um_filter_37_12]
MNFVDIIIIAVSLSLDACVVSLTAGAMNKSISYGKTILIAVTFGLFQAIMPVLGLGVGFGISSFMALTGHWIAFVLLAGVGGRMIYEAFVSDKKEKFSHKKSILNPAVLFFLAVATSIDAFVIGVSFAFVEVAVVLAIILICLITFVLSYICVELGKKFGELWGDKVELLGGLVLIGLGIKILLGGLL